jgi:hypothetical protein
VLCLDRTIGVEDGAANEGAAFEVLEHDRTAPGANGPGSQFQRTIQRGLQVEAGGQFQGNGVQCLQPVALGGELVVGLLEFCRAFLDPLLEFGGRTLHFGEQARIVDRLGCLACQRECDLCILIIVGADRSHYRR